MRKREVEKRANEGTVVSVRGSVVDAWFPRKRARLYKLLRCWDGGAIVIGEAAFSLPMKSSGSTNLLFWIDIGL